MTLGEFTRRRNAGEDVHLTKSSNDAETKIEAPKPTVQPATTGGDGTANISNGETSGRSCSGGSRSTVTPLENQETEETGCIAHAPSKKTEEGHETSDTLVEVFLPMPSDWLHPMGLMIPLVGLLSENPCDALKLEISNGPDRSPMTLTAANIRRH